MNAVSDIVQQCVIEWEGVSEGMFVCLAEPLLAHNKAKYFETYSIAVFLLECHAAEIRHWVVKLVCDVLDVSFNTHADSTSAYNELVTGGYPLLYELFASVPATLNDKGIKDILIEHVHVSDVQLMLNQLNVQYEVSQPPAQTELLEDDQENEVNILSMDAEKKGNEDDLHAAMHDYLVSCTESHPGRRETACHLHALYSKASISTITR